MQHNPNGTVLLERPYFSNKGENNTWSICPVSPKSFGEKSGENARFNMTLTGGKKMSKLLFQSFSLFKQLKLLSLYTQFTIFFFFFSDYCNFFFLFCLKWRQISLSSHPTGEKLQNMTNWIWTNWNHANRPVTVTILWNIYKGHLKRGRCRLCFLVWNV